MTYEVANAEFTAPNGSVCRFFYRKDTNDYYVVLATFTEDSYHLAQMNWQPSDVVIDVGAHIGAPAILALTYPGVEVYAYEVLSESVDLMRRNVEINGMTDRVHIFHRAVHARAGRQVKAYFTPKDPVHRWMGSVPGYERDSDEYEMVRTTSLSEIFRVNNIQRCRLLRTNAEGSEHDFIGSASVKTLSKIDQIVGQYHLPFSELRDGELPKDMLLRLTKGVFIDVTVPRLTDTPNLGMFSFVNKEVVT